MLKLVSRMSSNLVTFIFTSSSQKYCAVRHLILTLAGVKCLHGVWQKLTVLSNLSKNKINQNLILNVILYSSRQNIVCNTFEIGCRAGAQTSCAKSQFQNVFHNTHFCVCQHYLGNNSSQNFKIYTY